MTDKERLKQLEEELAQLEARLPKHSVPPAMIIELEDLEERIEQIRSRLTRDPE
jgi:hypothetical protein